MLAALLLTVVSFPVLFAGTTIGFVGSALLVVTTRLPGRAAREPGHFWADVTKGIRIYTRTPRLRGLMVMEASVAAAGAMIYVNTVVLVQARLGLGEEGRGAGIRRLRARARCWRPSFCRAFLERLTDRPGDDRAVRP